MEYYHPHANWELVPHHTRHGLALYVMRGVEPGGFLTAVLENNLKEAVGRADDVNRDALANIVTFLYNYAPAAAWGSVERVTKWITNGGELGDQTK